MATKYVEDYRNWSTLDADVIQAAITELCDGDTLIFEANRTYTLNKPVYFTKCNPKTIGGVSYQYDTKRYLTIEGNGCTIINNSTTFQADNDDNSYFNHEKKYLFMLSDYVERPKEYGENDPIEYGNGLLHSTIRGFKFICDGSEAVRNTYRCMGPLGSVYGRSGSYYTQHCKITDCEFYNFGEGLYLCGAYDNIEHCKFEGCKTGINCDCPNDNDIHSNYFGGTRSYGIKMTIPYRTKVYENYFYHCKGYYIEVDGVRDNQTQDEIIKMSIYSNVMQGGKIGGKLNNIDGKYTYNQTGIWLDGVKHAIVRDNIIRSMRYLTQVEKENTHTNANGYLDQDKLDADKRPIDNYEDYGIGICICGSENSQSNNYRTSRNVIVTGNEVSNCMRSAVKIDLADGCMFTNNLLSREIYNNEDYSDPTDTAGEVGIQIGEKVGFNTIKTNFLRNYKGNGIVGPMLSDEVFISNNISTNTYDYYDSSLRMRRIYGTERSTNIIIFPELNCPLRKNEKIKLYVSGTNSTPMLDQISYNGKWYYIYDKTDTTKVNIPLPSNYIGYSGYYADLQFKEDRFVLI